MSRHLRAVPDPEPSPERPSWSSYLTAETAPAWLAAMGVRSALDDGRPFRRHRTVIGEPATEAPGWWVCPSCGRRVDRADETRTITGRVCTGPDGRLRHRRHAPVAMEVQR